MNRRLFFSALILLSNRFANGQGPEGYNYDEARVGTYTLPDPLKNEYGKPVKTKAD